MSSTRCWSLAPEGHYCLFIIHIYIHILGEPGCGPLHSPSHALPSETPMTQHPSREPALPVVTLTSSPFRPKSSSSSWSWIENHDVIMIAMTSQINGVSFVCSTCVFMPRISKKSSKLRVTGLCEGNSPVTGRFPSQRASNAENVFIWWRHHETTTNSLRPSSVCTEKQESSCTWVNFFVTGGTAVSR